MLRLAGPGCRRATEGITVEFSAKEALHKLQQEQSLFLKPILIKLQNRTYHLFWKGMLRTS